jgi:hypothetical protein
MGQNAFWAIISQTLLVTLPANEINFFPQKQFVAAN